MVTMCVWVTFTVLVLCQASPEAIDQAAIQDAPLPDKGISEGVTLLNPQLLHEERTRTSHNCDQGSDYVTRKLCSDIQEVSMQKIQQVSSQEEARTLSQLGQNSPFSSYVNHGNAVHIQGQFHQPPVQGQRQNADHVRYNPKTNTDKPQPPVQLPQPDLPSLLRPSRRPPAHSNLENYTTRINSKLLSSEELAHLRSLDVQTPQEFHNSHSSQHQHFPHQELQQKESIQKNSQFHPQEQITVNTDNNGGEQDHYQPSLISQLQAVVTPNILTQKEASAVTSGKFPQPSPSSQHPLSVPLGNTVSIQMPDSFNIQNQEKKADIADILTNLQILTILMNQNGLDQPHGNLQDTLVTSVNGGSSVVNLRLQTPEHKDQQMLLQHEANQQHYKEELASNSSSTVLPKDLHKSGIYQIQARHKKASPKNYFTYASQFPFAINSSEDSPTPSNTVNQPGSSWSGPSYLPQEEPTFPGLSASIPATPEFSYYPSINPIVDSQTTYTTPASDINSGIIYKDPANILMSNDDDINHDQLINQYTQQLFSQDQEHPYTGSPEENPQSTLALLSQINALSEYLENLKKKFATQDPVSTSTPGLLYDPTVDSQDFILASLLHSQIQQQSSSNQAPSSFPANSPYVPAVHGTKDVYDEYYAPAPPPGGDLSVFPAEQNIDPVKIFSSSSSTSGGSSFNALAFSSAVAVLSTAAIALPLIMGKRKKREINDISVLQNIPELVENPAFLVTKGHGVENTGDVMAFYNALLNSDYEKYNEILSNITIYIHQNKEELLSKVAEEIEILSSKPIPKEFLKILSNDDTKRLMDLLRNIPAMQGKGQVASPHMKHYSRELGIHQPLEQAHAMNQPNSVTLNGYHNNFVFPTANNQRLYSPPKFLTGTNQVSKTTLQNSQSFSSGHHFPQYPYIRKPSVRQKPQEAQLSSTDQTMITQQIFSLYNSVCRVLTGVDNVPHTDVINFIAQRCLLLAYVGLLN